MENLKRKEMKKSKYKGPKPPKRKGKYNTLNSIAYLKAYFVNSKMYEEAAYIRDLERRMEIELNGSVIPPYNVSNSRKKRLEKSAKHMESISTSLKNINPMLKDIEGKIKKIKKNGK